MYVIIIFILMLLLFIVLPIKIAMWIAKMIKGSRNDDSVPERTACEESKEEHEKMSSSTVMLLVGTIFIVLSGIAFGVAGWVNTTPLGRVGIMLLASVVSFLISLLFRKGFKLTGTSIAFYTVGSVFSALTFITAGYYEMFGSTFAIDGELSALLYAITVLIISVMSVFGYRVYGNKTFAITGISAFYVAVHFVICQLTDNFRGYAITAMIVHMIITAIIHILRPQKSFALNDIITRISNIAAVVFGCSGIAYMINGLAFPDAVSVAINLIVIAELLFYGIRFKKQLLINAQSLFDILALIQIVDLVNGDIKTNALICSFGIIGIYLVHRFLPVLRTRFNEEATMLASLIAALVPLSFPEFTFIPYGIPSLIVTAIITTYIFSDDIAKQRMAGIVFPVVPFILTASLSDIKSIDDRTERYVFTFGILAIVLLAASAIFRYLPVIAKDFSEKHTRVSDSVIYSCLTVSGLIMLRTDTWNNVLLIFAAALPVHFYISSKLRNNFCTVFPLVTMTLLSNSYLRSLGIEETAYRSVVITLIFIGLIAVSKIFFKAGFRISTGERTLIDTPFIASFVPLYISWMFIPHGSFFFFMNHALLIAALIKSSTSKKKAAVLLSISAVLMAFAFISRSFLVPENEATAEKINLAIFALLGAAFRYIWREFPESARKTSDFIWHLAFFGLILDAFRYQTAGNTIFVLAVIAVIMIFSYLGRSKHWFKLSSVSVAAVTVYATRDYLMALDWWVYLFVAGLALISVAALNEYYKNKGESLKNKFNKNFAGWSR